MSDNDSLDITRRRRRSRWGGPLPPQARNPFREAQSAVYRAYLDEALSLLAQLEGEPGQLREAEERLLADLEGYPVYGEREMLRSRADRRTAAAAADTATQEPKKPITTVVSMLPKTTYNEADADAAGGPERTTSSVKAQRQLLKWLGTNPADTLSAHQARRWTQDIGPDKKPTAKDALRLCYYMRSQTFDVYADVKGGCMSLYVVNQGTQESSPRTDKLYWKQNITSNLIEYTAPSHRYAAPNGGRRGALAAQPTIHELEGMLAQLTDGLPAGPPPGWNPPPGNGEAEGEEEEGEVEQPAAAAGHPARQDWTVLMAGVQADLENLLSSDHPDTTAIEVALAQVEQYQELLERG